MYAIQSAASLIVPEPTFTEIGLSADLLGEFEELVRAKGIVLDRAAPVGIGGDAALLGIANAVPPVILVSEAAAGPAHIRHLDGLERAHDVRADTANVGDGGVLANPHTAIDAGAEMFCELTEDIAVDLGARLRGIDGDGHCAILPRLGEYRRGRSCKQQRYAERSVGPEHCFSLSMPPLQGSARCGLPRLASAAIIKCVYRGFGAII